MNRKKLEFIVRIEETACDPCGEDWCSPTCQERTRMCRDLAKLCLRFENVLDAMVANNPGDKERMTHHEWQALERARKLLAELNGPDEIKGDKP